MIKSSATTNGRRERVFPRINKLSTLRYCSAPRLGPTSVGLCATIVYKRARSPRLYRIAILYTVAFVNNNRARSLVCCCCNIRIRSGRPSRQFPRDTEGCARRDASYPPSYSSSRASYTTRAPPHISCVHHRDPLVAFRLWRYKQKYAAHNRRVRLQSRREPSFVVRFVALAGTRAWRLARA